MNPIKFKFGNDSLKVFQQDGQVFFDAEQAAIGLGIYQLKSGHKYVRWERVNKYLNSPQVGKGQYISEPQFYTLAIKADNSTARKFQHWVTSEVLPAIRKHGAYMTPQTIEKALLNPDTIINLATQLKKEQEQRKQLQAENEQMKPKALFADAVATSNSSILIGQLAKILRQNGIQIGQNRLFAWMREHGYLGTRGSNRNIPTQRSMELGLFKTKETVINHSDGHTTVNITTKVTGKGQQYFINKFLNAPVIEA
ncbi:phage antirepressor KilAC domain-containing protein [Limosilactobacillus reuteri]|uniref:phage antirepressor KilAC domain-containing protein n=1 Tax=Limosilactobacillus reuteri TaxID=1598 RepID=UPI00214C960B|nr:phage antirepressor KilAC domain-containing protein [Limosilactobacillus reuteri]MCR1893615.1 phage antirepressor KilAC domain-containing protein [Limosilactobacillus reuteri]